MSTLVNIIVQRSNDGVNRFFEESEKYLLSAILYYHIEMRAPFNISDVLLSLVRVDSGYFDIDLQNLNHLESSLAQRMYDDFNKMIGKSKKAIVASLATRMTIFNMTEIDITMMKTTIDLNVLKKDKQAIFVVYDETDKFKQVRQMFDFVLSKQFKNDFAKQMSLQYENYTMWFYDDSSEQMNSYLIDCLTLFKECNVCVSFVSSLESECTTNADSKEMICNLCDSILFLGSKRDDVRNFIKKILEYSKSLITSEIDMVDSLPEDKCIIAIRGLHAFYETRASSKNSVFDFAHYLD